MRSNKQKDIMIPKSGFKRSRFNWSHDVNTTFAWGEIQPTQCKMLIPGSKTTMEAQNLIRLAPMVAPTFGRVKFKTYNQFVSMEEIMPNFAALLAEEPVVKTSGKKVPKEVPSTKLGWLSQLCLMGAHATLYWTPSLAEAQLGHYRTYHKHWNDTLESWQFIPEVYNNIAAALFGSGTMGENKPFALSGNPLEVAASSLPDLGTRLCLRPRFFSNDFGAIHLNSGVQAARNPRIPLNAMDFSDLIPPAHDTPAKVYANSSINHNQRLCEVTPDSADYVLQFQYLVNDTTYYFALMFEFSDFGKRLRKILQGCGYQIDMCSNEYVSILPLLAQYKAYFDIFGLQLFKGWETTYAASLINYIEQNFIQKFPGTSNNEMVVIPCEPGSGAQTVNYLFLQFLINEVCNEWYTEDTDFVAAHLQSLAVSPAPSTDGFISVDVDGYMKNGANTVAGINGNEDADGTDVNQGEGSGNSVSGRSGHYFINQIQHGEVDAELLKRLYKWTNRNTILGREIAKILRAQGLGKYVDECKSNYIGSSDVMITISDVISTADTESDEGARGKALGEYGGRGLQYDQSGILVFENDEYGYWITLATVIPEAGYTQGVDPTLKVLDKMNFYNPDFDALGMELTGKDIVVGSSYLGGRGQTVQQVESFGFIPRYSKFKVTQNLVNGDFNRHGLRNTYLPYTLDKQMFIDDYETKHVEYNEENGITFVAIERSPIRSALPVAGNAWRYPTKYGFLGNFNRIFLNIGKKDDANASSAYNPEFLNNAIGYDDFNDDNFLGHGIYNVQCYAPMKPIENSYGLDEDDPTKGNGVEFVSKT